MEEGKDQSNPQIDNPKLEEHLRPISILPVLSKVFEKLVAVQMISFCENESVLGATISGFHKGHLAATVLMSIRNDLLKAMKKGEVTLMVMADFTKAFATVHYKTLIAKLSSLGFSKTFLRWLINYLRERSHFVQIDDRVSDPATVRFGVPQGSILGPVLFNLYVSDLQDRLPSLVTTFQYADDTTIYSSSRPAELHKSVEELNSSLNIVSAWSSEFNLALNPGKTKAMLLSTRQMSRVHGLDTNRPPVSISSNILEYVVCKLLGVYFHENLKWDEQVKAICKSCYGTIRILKKIKNFTDFKLRKQLAESLVLSKLNYCDTVFYPLPDFLLKRLQRLQFAAASFILGRYVNTTADLLKLAWLPLKELRDYSLLKCAYKAIYFDNWPVYLKLQLVQPVRNLRSTIAPRLVTPLTTNTFQYSASKIFNSLPAEIRDCLNYKQYCALCKNFLQERAVSSL